MYGGKVLKHLIAAAALALAVPGAASAVTFTGSFVVSGSALSDPGLVVSTSPGSGPLAFDLDLGGSTTFKLFDIWTDEGSISSDDRVPQSLEVAFNLSSPLASGSIFGSSVAEGLIRQQGAVTWNGPAQLGFGDGGILSVALSDATFNKGLFALNRGEGKGADIYATFTYAAEPAQVQTPAPVPLPAGLGLIVAGLGALGFAGGRSKTT